MTQQHSAAAICTHHGDARDVIQIQQYAVPDPGPGQVRVRMLAAPVNPSDILFCKGTYGIGPEPPMLAGLEGTGIVETAGAGFLGHLHVGKRVAVIASEGGTWSESCITRAETIVPVPHQLTNEQAAAYFINPATALLMTHWVFELPRDAWLIQSAANSAVGRMIIRLGKHFGFRTLNVVRREEAVSDLLNLGGDAVLVATETTTPHEFSEQVSLHCNGNLPRFAVDPVGGHTGGLLFASLGQGGQMLSYASLADAPIPIHPRMLITHDRHLKSFWLGRAVESLSLLKKVKLIRELGRLHEQGLFQVENFEVYPLQNITAALEAASRNQGGKKVLLRMNDK